jgi:heme A synthase
MIFIWWLKSGAVKENRLFLRLRFTLMLLVSLQVIMGILTVLNAIYPDRLVWLGVSHQFTAMLLVMAVVCLLYVTNGPWFPKVELSRSNI